MLTGSAVVGRVDFFFFPGNSLSRISSFSQYLLRAHLVPGTLIVSGNGVMNREDWPLIIYVYILMKGPVLTNVKDMY